MSRGPRVVCACDWLVKYTAGLARGLADAGASSLLLSRTHDFEFGGVSGAMAAYVEGVLDGAVEHIALPGRPREVGSYRDVARARRRVHRFAPDAVHLQRTVVDDPRLLAVAGARPGRYALTIHDVVPHPGDAVHGGVRRRLERLLVRHAALTFVHAESLADELRRRFGDVPVAVVPHGVDAPAPSPLPVEPSILFFGRISRYKGLDVLLEALPEVWRRVPGLQVRIAGRGELPANDVLTDSRVTLDHRHVADSELPGLFGGATCVVLPYLEASQSGVGSQAKQFGRGMIVSDTGGLPELTADGSGLLVPPGDAGALADAIVRVVTDRALAERLSTTAAAGVATSGWRAVAELTLEAYARYGLLSAGTGSPRRAASKIAE